MSIIMRNQFGLRRAHFITTEDADKLVKEGKAIKHGLYDIYEESDAGEYETKVMTPAKSKRKKAADEEADK